jgi:hypothetical protein
MLRSTGILRPHLYYIGQLLQRLIEDPDSNVRDIGWRSPDCFVGLRSEAMDRGTKASVGLKEFATLGCLNVWVRNSLPRLKAGSQTPGSRTCICEAMTH